MGDIYKKLLSVQCELKAPKNQRNSFGNYNYRNCEDILEAAKPLLKKNGCTVLLSDCIEMIGERYYVKAEAKFVDIDSGESFATFAYARESDSKKGMDEAQVTGATSSYARKYALNGLFDIDDNKDADTDEHRKEEEATYTKYVLPKRDVKFEVRQNMLGQPQGLPTTIPPAKVDMPFYDSAEEKKDDDKFFKCEECGKILLPYTATAGKNKGKAISIREHEELSKKHCDGHVFCQDCMKHYIASKKEAKADA